MARSFTVLATTDDQLEGQRTLRALRAAAHVGGDHRRYDMIDVRAAADHGGPKIRTTCRWAVVELGWASDSPPDGAA